MVSSGILRRENLKSYVVVVVVGGGGIASS
jgi:hypothetical protein